MITSEKAKKRKKTNFMIGHDILIEISKWIPAGERSNFVNGVLEAAILRYRREKAFQAMDELREKAKLRMTDKEIIRLKNYGRP
jgi:hypothetical protein